MALSARDERELLSVAERLCADGVRHVLIREPDPPHFGAATAIGIVPTADRATVKQATKRLRLITEKETP